MKRVVFGKLVFLVFDCCLNGFGIAVVDVP